MKNVIFDRRQFAITLGAGAFQLGRLLAGDEGETVNADAGIELPELQLPEAYQVTEHWTPEENENWRWYRLEQLVDDSWESMGITRPVHKESGELADDQPGYLGLSDVPDYVLSGDLPKIPDDIRKRLGTSQFGVEAEHQPSEEVRARHGRPPSEWLLSLHARDLRVWLQTMDAPEASVRGMTFWVHLVRDHGFDPRRIEGLTEEEFLQLHSAAHYGY